jgi:hypothetical protein
MPTLPMFLDITTRQTFGEQYKRGSSSLCPFLHFFPSSFLGPNVFLSSLFSIHAQSSSSFYVRKKVNTRVETAGSTAVSYILVYKYEKITI